MSTSRILVLRAIIACIALTLAAALTSCRNRVAYRPTPESCRVVSAEEAADTVTVALPTSIDLSYGPWPRNGGERLLFYHCYQTLISVDCDGRVAPSLANQWQRHDGGSRWTFKIRQGARFSDGSVLAAGDVAWSWELARTDPNVHNMLVTSTRVVDAHTIDVYLRAPSHNLPRAFASLSYAVARPVQGLDWLVGSGPYQVATATHDEATLTPIGDDEPVLVFRHVVASDARDVLESGVDVLVTSDPGVIEYARGKPSRTVAPLPWSVTHVLVSTARARVVGDGGAPPQAPAELTDALARDAVRIDARGCRKPYWWTQPDCAPQAGAGDVAALLPALRGYRIVYPAGDDVARALAERIVALLLDPNVSPHASAMAMVLPGYSGTHEQIAAEGLSPDAFARSLRFGSEFGYVVSLPHRVFDPCEDTTLMLDRAPWLRALGERFALAMIPLVDTRSHVIANRDGADISADWFARVLVTPPSWREVTP